ncbi:hypothetical protein [Xanthovirga aplysinae]|nr:hypothetical protein [Xanthovirga aplysinae]
MMTRFLFWSLLMGGCLELLFGRGMVWSILKGFGTGENGLPIYGDEE